MSDDRFQPDSTVFKKPEAKQDWLLLEDALREAIKEGAEQTFVVLIKLLPDEKREKYRRVWAEAKAGKEC